jgi:hypothetical protein
MIKTGMFLAVSEVQVGGKKTRLLLKKKIEGFNGTD